MRLTFHAFSLVCLLHLGATASLLGDTITLKSGEKVSGKVTSETDQQLTIEYKASASITDSRTIPKSDVAKIEKENPDEAAYLAIKNLKPGASSTTPASYDQMTRGLEAFISQYPKSAHTTEVTQTLADFKAERERVDAGELKLGGKWISKEEAQKERYQLSARVLLGQMQDQARRGDLPAALNTFDQIEKTYPGAAIFSDAVDAARSYTTQLKTLADRGLQNWLVQKKERDTGTQLLAEPQRSELIAVQAREQKQFESAVEAAATAGLRWPPFLPRSEKSMTELSTKAATEQTRLQGMAVAPMRESIQLAEKARAALTKGELAPAEDLLAKATALWSPNELATRLSQDLSAGKTAAASAPEPGPAAVPEAATPAPAPIPLPRSTPAPEEGASPAPAPAPEEEPHRNFFTTPLGIGLSLVVLGVLTAIYLKQRKARASVEEQEQDRINQEREERERLKKEGQDRGF